MTGFVRVDDGYCSPKSHEHYTQHGSCFSHNELRSIAHAYNSIHANAGLKGGSRLHEHPIPEHAFSDPRLLVKELHARFKPVCKSKGETCWLTTHVLSRSNIVDELRKRFRPQMPKSWVRQEKQWLNTFDIMSVMKQYEEKYEFFEFLGVFPVDFRGRQNNTCIVQSMCNFNLMEFLQKGKTDFGMVINLDPHYKSGSHWVAMYGCFDTDKKKFGLSYYDSTADTPPNPVMKFMADVYKEVKLMFPDDFATFRMKYNPKKHQFKNSECGMFSMVYLIHCLENRNKTYHFTRSEFVGKNMYDDNIWKMRKKLYSPPTN